MTKVIVGFLLMAVGLYVTAASIVCRWFYFPFTDDWSNKFVAPLLWCQEGLWRLGFPEIGYWWFLVGPSLLAISILVLLEPWSLVKYSRR